MSNATMAAVTISPARWEDADAIRKVSDACYQDDYILHMLDAFLSTGTVLVAWEGQGPVGFVKVNRALDGSSWLSALRVVPSRRRRGIGARLSRACEDVAREGRSPVLRLWTERTNGGAVALFESLSYRPIGAFTRWWAEAEALASSPPEDLEDLRSVLDLVQASRIFRASHGYVPLEFKFCRLDASIFQALRASRRLYRDAKGAPCVLDGEVWKAFGEQMVEATLLGDDLSAQAAAAAGLAARRGARLVGAFLPAGQVWDGRAQSVGLQRGSWGRHAVLYEKELTPSAES